MTPAEDWCPACGYPRFRDEHDEKIHWVVRNWYQALRYQRLRAPIPATLSTVELMEADHVEDFHYFDPDEICTDRGNRCPIILRERARRRLRF